MTALIAGLAFVALQAVALVARLAFVTLLACLLFGAAAWKAAARDQWVGWDAQERQCHLGLLSNNARLMVLPWVRVPHLASHLLGRVAARLSADWQQKYAKPVYLLETFVEGPRFAGTCCRAAGCVRVGLTTGRTRNKDGRKPRGAPKASNHWGGDAWPPLYLSPACLA